MSVLGMIAPSASHMPLSSQRQSAIQHCRNQCVSFAGDILSSLRMSCPGHIASVAQMHKHLLICVAMLVCHWIDYCPLCLTGSLPHMLAPWVASRLATTVCFPEQAKLIWQVHPRCCDPVRRFGVSISFVYPHPVSQATTSRGFD